MVYGYDGEIWRLAPGAKEPARVQIRITRGTLLSGRYHVQLNRQATEITVSPNGRELAIIVRGDVFVVSALSGATRRITNTPEQERGVSFGPRGADAGLPPRSARASGISMRPVSCASRTPIFSVRRC